MFCGQKCCNRAAGGYKVVDRSHWQCQSDMSRASLNKNISENDHKATAEFLRPRYASSITGFCWMLASIWILAHKANLEIIQPELFFILPWGNWGQNWSVSCPVSYDKHRPLLSINKQELGVNNQKGSLPAGRGYLCTGSPKTVLSHNHFASHMPFCFSNECQWESFTS